MRRLATAFVALSFLVGIAFADQEQATATFPTELIGLPTDEGLSERCIEIAETAAQRSLGYMFRTDILPSDGMLFVFDPPRPVAMWMKNTPTSLDMLFIEPDGTVAKIAPNTEPFSTEVIAAEANIGFVLELLAGQTDALGINRGDKVVGSWFDPSLDPKPCERQIDSDGA